MSEEQPDLDLGRITTLSFDCYGTLIDWETGLLAALVPWRVRTGPECTDDELLEAFARWESAVETENPAWPYPAILREVMRRLAREAGREASESEAGRFGASVGDWPPFADSPAALARLAERYRLMILSNVDRVSFARSERALGVRFDEVLIAEEIGSYKPDRRNFEALLRRLGELGVAPEQHLHVAQSLYHDIGPAQQLGIATVWVDRRRGRKGSGATPAVADVRADLVVGSLAELVTLLEGSRPGASCEADRSGVDPSRSV